MDKGKLARIGILMVIVLVVCSGVVCGEETMTDVEIGNLRIISNLGFDRDHWGYTYYEAVNIKTGSLHYIMMGDANDEVAIVSRTGDATFDAAKAAWGTYEQIGLADHTTAWVTDDLLRDDLYTDSSFKNIEFAKSLRRVDNHDKTKVPGSIDADKDMTPGQLRGISISSYMGTDREGHRYYRVWDSTAETNAIIRLTYDEVHIAYDPHKTIGEITVNFQNIDPTGDVALDIDKIATYEPTKHWIAQMTTVDGIDTQYDRWVSAYMKAGASEENARQRADNKVKAQYDAYQSGAKVTPAAPITDIEKQARDELKGPAPPPLTPEEKADAEKAAKDAAEKALPKREGELSLTAEKPAGTGIGAISIAEKKYYYDSSRDSIVPLTEQQAKGITTLTPISNEQVEAVKAGLADKKSVSFVDGKFKLVDKEDEKGVVTITTEVIGEEGLEIKTTTKTVKRKTVTTVTDADGKIKKITGPGDMDLGTSKGWDINKDGKLTFKGKAAKTIDKNRRTAEMEDGRVITIIEDGVMELSADKGTVTLRIVGQKEPTELDAEDYTKLTGLDPKSETALSPEQRTSLKNLGEVIKTLGKEGIGLDDIAGQQLVTDEGSVYWTSGVRIVFSPDGKTVTTTTGTIITKEEAKKRKLSADKIGQPDDSKPREITTKENGKVTEIVRHEATDKPGEFKTVKTTWNYKTGIATIAGKDYKFSATKDGTIIGYETEVDGKARYYSIEEDAWFEDPKFEKECTTDCPSADITAAIIGADDAKASKEDRDTSTARAVQRFWGFLETAARGGIGRFFSLFMEDEELAEWREKVDDFLCSTIIAGGVECWTSEICGTWVDNRVGGGLVYTETPTGMLDIAAHIEGERTRIETPAGTQYLYKLTYMVKNTKTEELGFNIYLYGDKTTPLYSNNIVLEEGATSSRIGNSAVVQYSDSVYNKVCVVFTESIEIAGDSIREVCNKIVEYHGAALTVKSAQAQQDKAAGQLPVKELQI